MNFIIEYNKGQEGGNKGLPFGPGLEKLDAALNGIQRGRNYCIAAPSKAGKSTFVDYSFVIQPYLYSLIHNLKMEWIYFSFEIDRVSKEFEYATSFLHSDHNIGKIDLPTGVFKKEQPYVELSPDYLRGRVQDDTGKLITVPPHIKAKLIQVYENRIIPMFGEYSTTGIQLKKGVIIIVEEKDNPTGLRNYLLKHARLRGTFRNSADSTNSRISGYTPNDPELYTFVITDHLRKLQLEQGFNLKQTVDKYTEYSVEFRNWCQWTFAHIIHINRNMNDMQRLKSFGDRLYPSSEDIKDTGNLAEEVDYLITMFNPSDDRYNLTKHFGVDIKDSRNNIIYPYLRTLHLVESRHCEFPQHFSVNMHGGYKTFKKFEIKKQEE